MHKRSAACRVPCARRGGFTMIEVLVALLVFSLGVLALVSIQATATRMAGDARDRAVATFLADQLLARMLIADPATATTFQHKPSGTTACNPSGAESTNAVVTGWLAEVLRQLPNATAGLQQIVVVPPSAPDITARVIVTLCWQNGNDAPRSLSVSNQVQWQL
ncbi:type IV pilus modification protein PilV [Rubrivivax rivuli]|nr:type IV pilus modification protein PilV [Rubrivivax rivuli]